MSGQPIIIEDDGSGMTQEEISRHYLLIANDRRARSGERTAIKNRKVKGKKGIGKFSGLMAASVMQLETWARGSYCTFTLKIEDLNKVDDIEQLQLPIKIQDFDSLLSGTRITLTNLHQDLIFPSPNKLRQVLLQEYGREEGFAIFVDGKPLDIDDAPCNGLV